MTGRLWTALAQLGALPAPAWHWRRALAAPPEECRYLSSKRYLWQSAKLGVMKRVFGRQFDRKLRRMEEAHAA